MKLRTLYVAITTCLLATASFPTFSANIPANTQLADKQELVRGNGAEVATLDPQLMEGVPESNVIFDLFENLVIQDDHGNIIPGVATSWETTDNKTYIFHLRNNAKWSNGDSVTASDFVYAWRRLADPKVGATYSSYLEASGIKNAKAINEGKKPLSSLGVTAMDTHTLKVELDRTVPYFVSMTSSAAMAPVHKKTVEKWGDAWTQSAHIVSNGAFKLSKRVINERLVMVRNPYYWDNKHTILNKVTYLPIEDSVSEMNRFLAGEIDMTSTVPSAYVKKLKKENKDVLKFTPALCTYYYAFNTEKKPLNDVRVRQALSYAIDRNVIANIIVGKGEVPAYGFANKDLAGYKIYSPEYAHQTQAELNKKAKALMKAAGIDKDHPLDITLLYNTNDSHKKIAVAIASMYKKLGINIHLENQEWKTFLDSKRNGEFDIARAGWCGEYNEASSFLSLLTTGNNNNDARYSNIKYDELMNKAKVATTAKERADDYHQAEAILARDMPIAPIYYYVNTRLVKKNIGGFPMHNPQDNIYLKDIYIKKIKNKE